MPKKGTKCRKTPKICIVCGKTFEGTESAQSCSPTCRTRLVRIKAAKKRPEFILIAKSKGQKIPDLNAPKRLKFKKGEKKGQVIKEIIDNIEFVTPIPVVYDSGPISNLTIDEPGQFQKPPTHEQLWAKIEELTKRKSDIKISPKPEKMVYRMWTLHQADMIKEVDKEIEQTKELIRHLPIAQP